MITTSNGKFVAEGMTLPSYNTATHGTLTALSTAVADSETLYRWVWLDEWDLAGPQGSTKRLYTPDTFKACRDAGLKIGLVTPELHGTSPGLLGGEAHPEASPLSTLLSRIEQILHLDPDAICTDHPDQAQALYQKTKQHS